MREKGIPIVPDEEQLAAARKAHCLKKRDELGLRYMRYADDFHRVPRGTIVIGDRIIPGYPHIGRVFALKRGIENHFDGAIHVEEKIDGYNVRIVAVDGRLLAFTRSGIVCPFTSDRLPDLLDLDAALGLWRERPELVLCAEVAGPDNPYIDATTPRVSEDIGLFVFDFLLAGRPEYMPLDQRDELIERYHLPRVQRFGRFTAADVDRLRAIVCELEDEGAEGIVMKTLDGKRRLKYVTPSSAIRAVRSDAVLEWELPGEFYVHRIVRLAICLRELGLRERDHSLAIELGEAMLEGFEQGLDDLVATGEVAKTFRFKVRDPQSADRLLEVINRGARTVRVREVERRTEDGYTHVTFRKRFIRSTSMLADLLDGRAITD